MRRTGDLQTYVDPFKRCSLCSREWRTREEFLNDSENHFDGYQYVPDNGRNEPAAGGLLIFTHRRCTCGTSLAILGSRFEITDLARRYS